MFHATAINQLPGYQRCAELFDEHFDGANPEWLSVAPGRVNLIGEHTDYNDGYVLPMAIDRYVVVVAKVNHSKRCRVIATDVEGGEMATFFLNDTLAPGKTRWANYVKGVLSQFLINGQRIPPFDMAIASSIPLGAGLSSSAALEVAVATLVESLLGIRVDPVRKAKWCQAAEHEFVGVPCGLMDQLAVIHSPLHGAVMIDCRSLEMRHVQLDPSLAVIVTDSGVRHDLADSEYGLRRDQCADAVRALSDRYPHIEALRDARLNELIAVRDSIDPIAFRRARHVILENQRVRMVADALDSGYFETAGFLMYESHRSLRDDYEVSCTELDMLVRLTRDMGEVYGSRMTGGGFGGSTVTLCRAEAADAVVEALTAGFHTHTGRAADSFVVRPAGSARLLSLHGRP